MWLTGLDLRCQPEPLFPPGIPYGIPSLDPVWGKVWEQLDKIVFLPCPVLSSAKVRPGSTERRKREEEADAGVRSFAQSWRGGARRGEVLPFSCWMGRSFRGTGGCGAHSEQVSPQLPLGAMSVGSGFG